MTAFEECRDQLRAAFIERLDIELVNEIVDIVCVTLGNYDCTRKELAVVVYDGGDLEIMKRFFLAKAVQGCTVKTAEMYRLILEKFFIEAKCHVKEATPDIVRWYIAQKKLGGTGEAYLALIHRTLSSFYTWCTAEDIVAKNPMDRVEHIKVRKKVEPALTDEQLEQLRYAARSKRDKAIIEFLYSTGCRVSEMCALNKNDLNFDRNEVEVLGKGRKYRTVYLSQRCCFALRDYLDSRKDDSEALFIADYDHYIGRLGAYQKAKNGDKRLSADAVRDILQRCSKRCDFKVHPHLLRKTVATQALRKGMPIDQVRAMLGHESIATTTIYAQTQQDDVKHSHEKFV